jgi:capsid protein
LKLLGANRGLTQMIEGDRIFMPLGDMPAGDDPNSWVNGVKIDPRTGRAKAYAISNRVGKSGKQLDRIVSARSLILHANYENRFDQVRGVSPLAAALNQLRDVYESIDYELAKQKLNSLFALAIMRETGAQDGPTLGAANYSTNSEGQAVDPVIDMMKGPTVLELQPGESASVLESHTPSTETVAFLQLLLQISLRALDIPFSAFSENFTNFFGSRSALIHYLLACDKHIAALQALQDAHFKWRVGIAVEDGELILPSGRDFEFIQWQFQPGGIPWWSPENEARGAAMSIAMGVTSPQRVCREIGTDFERNIDEIAEAMQYAASKGVPLVFADSGAFSPAITVGATNE